MLRCCRFVHFDRATMRFDLASLRRIPPAVAER
jgi:hypothetical protein